MFDGEFKDYKVKEKFFMDWWSETLKEKYPNPQKRETICAILTRNTIMGLGALQASGGSDWLPFFQDKMMKWNIKQEVGD